MLADTGRDRRETLFIGEEFSRDPRACWDYGLELQTRENRGQLSDRQTLSPGPAGTESAGLPAQPGSSRVQIVPLGMLSHGMTASAVILPRERQHTSSLRNAGPMGKVCLAFGSALSTPGFCKG